MTRGEYKVSLDSVFLVFVTCMCLCRAARFYVKCHCVLLDYITRRLVEMILLLGRIMLDFTTSDVLSDYENLR